MPAVDRAVAYAELAQLNWQADVGLTMVTVTADISNTTLVGAMDVGVNTNLSAFVHQSPFSADCSGGS